MTHHPHCDRPGLRMDAQAQKELMDKAQTEATRLYEGHWARYEHEARRAIGQQMASLLGLFDVDLDVRFADDARGKPTDLSALKGPAPSGLPTASAA